MKLLQQTIALLFLLFCAHAVHAQQEPLNAMYMYNGIAVNPAYTGTRAAFSATLMHRRQWVSMEGAPVTSSFSFHTPIQFTNLSLGASFTSDKIGPITDFYGTLYAAYKVSLSESLTLSMGMNLGLYNYNASLDDSYLGNGGFDEVMTNDNYLLFNGGAGLYLYHDRFYLGAAVPKLGKGKLTALPVDGASLERHGYITAGGIFPISETLLFKPSTLVRYVEGAPLDYDINGQFYLYNKFSLGGSWRTDNSIIMMAGFHIQNKWQIAYSYGMTTSGLSDYNSGSHELILTCDIRLKKRKVRTQRYYF